MESIPIVDFSKLSFQNGRNPSESDWSNTAQETAQALNQFGFVYIKNSDIPSETIERAFDQSKRFFQLPTKIKRKYARNFELNFGFTEPGQELLHPKSTFELRETFDLGRNLIQPFPSEFLPDFHQALLDLSNESQILLKKLLKILALALNLKDEDFFVKTCKWIDEPRILTNTLFRSIYYPPIQTGEDGHLPPGSVRCAEHSDYGIITLLFQDQLGGLEVKNVRGQWIPANPIEGTVLVNTGDLLEIWSNGFFPATHHRVLIPSIELKKRTHRQSMAYFINTDDDTIVRPIFPDQDFEPFSATEYVRKRVDLSFLR